ncbi:hypothetical protein C8R43DRAFT_1051391 [Mycena crocata]|nr:hypothetical protein C8R43DRAFT_1051391 [Mycena crocata]
MSSESAAAREADRVRLVELDEAISALKRSLNLLEIEQKSAQDRLHSYKYPVLTLPNEITSEIFARFVPAYPLCPPFEGLLSPNILMQICRQWRQIALATPTLWRAILLRHLTGDQHPMANLMQWIARSGSCPLSIRESNRYTTLQPEALELLAPHRARWDYLQLGHLQRKALSFLRDPMPLLRYLEFSTMDDRDRFDEHFSLGDAPLLRCAVLNDCAASYAILPWAQLTSLTLQSVYPRDCTPVLQQTTGLVYCELEVWLDNNDDDEQPDITLPHLQSLVLYLLHETGKETGYLKSFVVPALRSLQTRDALLGPKPIQTLTSFILKSGCTLQELRITGRTTVSKASYRVAFSAIPTVTFHRASHGRIEEGDEEASETDSDSDGSDAESSSESG